jgi:hypothetical protein
MDKAYYAYATYIPNRLIKEIQSVNDVIRYKNLIIKVHYFHKTLNTLRRRSLP